MNFWRKKFAVKELVLCWRDNLAISLVDGHQKVGEKALIETQLAALLNICKAEEVDDRVDLAVVHLPGCLSYSFHQHLGLTRAIFTKENPDDM